MKRINRNLIERGLWTLAQAALGFLTVELADLPVAYAPVVAAGLSFLKTAVQDGLKGASDG